MNTHISTDESQADRLIQCGVSPSTADMGWREIIDPFVEKGGSIGKELRAMKYESMVVIYGEDAITPAWSLSRLLALMPTTINVGGKPYYLDFAPYENKGWGFGYFNADGVKSIKGLTHPSDPIESAVCLIEWLNGNEYSLNLINDLDNEKENQNSARN